MRTKERRNETRGLENGKCKQEACQEGVLRLRGRLPESKVRELSFSRNNHSQ